MDSAIYDELQGKLATEGPAAAIERLCSFLRDRKDYGGLFYALLLKKRFELGLSPVPSGMSQDIPENLQGPYEDTIRDAGRVVGKLYLDEGNIPQAWVYYRMLNEPAPIVEALEQFKAEEGEDCQQIVEIAFHHGVHPRKGFDMILQRYGLCSAITTMSSREVPLSDEARAYCVQRLIRTLHSELLERLKAEIMRREGSAPEVSTVQELMAGRDWLFEDEFYHVDVSHLGAVVQMAKELPRCDELRLACELCAYGQRLSPRFQYAGDPPFEDQYKDYGVYLATLAGVNVEEGIAYFRAKAEKSNPEEEGTLAAEALINLLLKLDRPAEALAVARKYLAAVDDRRLTCPGIAELCQKVNDYQALAEVARTRQDPVHFMAGLLASRS